MLSIPEVLALAVEVPPRYEALVHLLVWSGVRIGEASARQRRDLELTTGHASISVRERVYSLKGVHDIDTPKRAGRAFAPSRSPACWPRSSNSISERSPAETRPAWCSRPRTAATSERRTTKCCAAP